MTSHKIIRVKKEHIPLGIEKYKGKFDEELARHLKNAKLDYIPYLFEDGRVLMVLEILETAFLYPSQKAVFETLLSNTSE
jgi:hypothetical protein